MGGGPGCRVVRRRSGHDQSGWQPNAAIPWGATAEVVTGRRLVLFVAMSTSRGGDCFRRTTTSDRDSRPLSERERLVVGLIALGSTGATIADELQIAHDTVRRHVRNSMTKLRAPLEGTPRGERSRRRRGAGLSRPNRTTAVLPRTHAPATLRRCASRVGSNSRHVRGTGA